MNGHHDERRRFSGIARIYGEEGLRRIQSSHVCVAGIGGVGSWAAESLGRSGVGKLTLVDLDIIVESNINRQVHSLEDTLGRNKGDVMSERLRAINPQVEVEFIDEFISVDNIRDLVPQDVGYLLDCIDSFRVKAALIHFCRREGIPVITAGGAGGKSDPSRIRLADLSRTEHDPLLARTRKLLRQDYGFSRNLKRRFDIPCVYSTEQPVYPTPDGGISPFRPEDISATDLGCAGGLGSVSTVTATFGMFAASHVLRKIATRAD